MDIFSNLDSFFARYDGFGSVLGHLGTIGSIFMVVLLVELAYDTLTKRGKGFADSVSNLTFVGIEIVLGFTLYSMLLIALLVQVESYAAFHIPITPWSWFFCLIATDFTYYWMHRSEHQVRVLWAYHSVHHTSNQYNLTTAVRLFWFLDLFMWVYYIPMVLLGFDVAQILTCLLVIFTSMTWIHTEKIGRIPVLEWIINTPSFHRVHHGRNKIYIDKNFGGLFSFWDRLFGTFEPEVEKVEFGVCNPIHTVNPLKIGLIEFTRLMSDMTKTKSWRERLNYVIQNPGWQPKPPPEVPPRRSE